MRELYPVMTNESLIVFWEWRVDQRELGKFLNKEGNTVESGNQAHCKKCCPRTVNCLLLMYSIRKKNRARRKKDVLQELS